MFRTFNMGIGMIMVLDKKSVQSVTKILRKYCKVYEIGQVVSGNKTVELS